MLMTANHYFARGETRPGGEAHMTALAATIPFDGSKTMGESVPGPAHLLAASLGACLLKNVERFSHMLPFEYSRASVEVAFIRQHSPPRILRAPYTLDVDTSEPAHRCSLLHRNIVKFGTISSTLAQACELSGSLRAHRPGGDIEAFDLPPPGGT
ncbi:MAG: putative OsmC-like protein [Myxococcota bacterium]|jgi:uncharacterized OsmC-like protein